MLATLCSALPAQDSGKTGPIVIEVKDQSGGIIPGQQVQIELSPNITGKNLWTDVDGRIHLGLPPGSYDLGVTSPGFARMKKRVEVQDGAPQFLSVVLRVGSCSGYCGVVEEVALEQPLGVSPDQRYAIVWADSIASLYMAVLESRDGKTRRELFPYDRNVLVLWSPDSKAFAVTGYVGGNISRCSIFSVDDKVPPIPVLDLFARQLSEIEREDLEGHLSSPHAKIQALAWIKPTDLEVEASAYDDRNHINFKETYTLPVDLHPEAAAPIWPK
jgi:hypothetical protein